MYRDPSRHGASQPAPSRARKVDDGASPGYIRCNYLLRGYFFMLRVDPAENVTELSFLTKLVRRPILPPRATLWILSLTTTLVFTGCTTLLGDFKLTQSDDAAAPSGSGGSGGSVPSDDSGPIDSGPPPMDGACTNGSTVCQGLDLYS